MAKDQTKYHYDLSDHEADKFFEEVEQTENLLDTDALIAEHGDEQFIYEATPYSYIQDFLVKFAPQKKEVIYDLGSGYGRFVIFCALNSAAHFIGIEISADRNARAAELAKKLHLDNVEFQTGNVLDFDLSDGDVFFLFNPFKPRTMEAIGQKLRDIAETKQIKIATWGGASNNYFVEQSWLEEIVELNPYTPLQYFISKNIC